MSIYEEVKALWPKETQECQEAYEKWIAKPLPESVPWPSFVRNLIETAKDLHEAAVKVSPLLPMSFAAIADLPPDLHIMVYGLVYHLLDKGGDAEDAALQFMRRNIAAEVPPLAKETFPFPVEISGHTVTVPMYAMPYFLVAVDAKAVPSAAYWGHSSMKKAEDIALRLARDFNNKMDEAKDEPKADEDEPEPEEKLGGSAGKRKELGGSAGKKQRKL